MQPLQHRPWFVYLVFFVSGFAALVYQVLWVRELGLMFGSTAQAAALTIAIFFAGIALGGWFWGRRARGYGNSLRAFGLVELGVAVTALGHFMLVDIYHAAYPALYQMTAGHPAADTLLKAVIAATILLPPAVLMGGTLPLMAQHMITVRDRLAVTGTALYAVNTAGSASGALAAGFVLPLALGFRDTYLLAVGLDILVGATALLVARGSVRPGAAGPAAAPRQRPRTAAGHPRHGPIWLVAFASGFATLGVEVAWTRLFSQVLQNSVYTYSLVLVSFLLALSLGAVLANALARLRRFPPEALLTALLIAAGVATAASPWVFHLATDGLGSVGQGLGWWAYLAAIALVAVQVVLLPGMVLGAVLPYLLRLLHQRDAAPGDTLGRLVFSNTAGAIVGTLTVGFVLLAAVGTGRTLLLLGAVYPVLAAFLLLEGLGGRHLAGACASALLAGCLIAASPLLPPPVVVNPERGESLVAVREGSHATASVIERNDNLLIRVNSYYVLGGTGASRSERNQTRIPMTLHPAPRSVFYLGMGTGITAGASMRFPVERVVICEILPEVIDLARAHFGPWTKGLFTDPRVEIHAEDGRNCLARSRERYDLIISDLFTPWKAGTGNLYTLEHYRQARERLNAGGLYVQWLPLYQVSREELAIIARTMQEAFPQVLLWRGDYHARRPIVALVGQERAAPLDIEGMLRQTRHFYSEDTERETLEANALGYYAGNLTLTGIFDTASINTDDNGLIEYRAPRTQRGTQDRRAEWMTLHNAAGLHEQLATRLDPADDPYLEALDPRQRDYVVAGRSFFHYRVLDALGEDQLARDFLADFRRRLGREP